MIKFVAVFVFLLSLGGVLSREEGDGALSKDKKGGPRKCKNPTGNLWTSALKGCGQAVCKKKGSKAVWEVCPEPATKKDLEDSLKKTEENVLASLRVLEKKLETICDDGWYTTPAPPTDCPEQWLMFGSNCYKYPEGDTANWADAESKCQSLLAGAHLASIHSAEEMQFVRDNVPTDHTVASWIWLGATNLNGEGSWTWTDGSSWDYTDWYPGQPDNLGGSENCLEELLYAGVKGWNDRLKNFSTFILSGPFSQTFFFIKANTLICM